MAKPTGFMEHERVSAGYRPVDERLKDYKEVDLPLHPDELKRQATRCMDCGVPTCHGYGCPVKNRIPEFNDLVRQNRWREASDNLHSTNNFPEFTGRVCPAPCEPACTLAINDDPVTIKHIEYQIIERAFAEGWITPQIPQRRTGKRVAIIGSGPAGLATAQQLARAGHHVTVFEKDDRIGGLMRYGIPDFKFDKHILERRLKQMTAEGVEFLPSVHVGVDVSARYLRQMFDATILAMGAQVPRDLYVPGRTEANNIHFAMPYLTQQNRINAGDKVPDDERIDAAGKIVVVIGGGDTGSDCVGTANRQGAKEVHQFELLDMPPREVDSPAIWPHWPRILRTSSSHQEGCQRRWSICTKGVVVQDGEAVALQAIRVEWKQQDGKFVMEEVAGSEFEQPVGLVLIAAGFVHVTPTGLVDQFGLKLSPRGDIAIDSYRTSELGVFAAGDCHRGASLVVHAINHGRECAEAVDQWLQTSNGNWATL